MMSTVVAARIRAAKNAPCSRANPPSMKVPAKWNLSTIAWEKSPAVPDPAIRMPFFTLNVAHERTTGTIPMTTAGQWRCGVASKAWTVMMSPTQTMIAIPASAGTAQPMAASEPVKHTAVMKTALSVEYPARAPIRFQAGCPM
jgi:hypothetical protein